jgi:hypothetical protein
MHGPINVKYIFSQFNPVHVFTACLCGQELSLKIMNLRDISHINFAMGPLKTVVLIEESVICDDYRYVNYTLH